MGVVKKEVFEPVQLDAEPNRVFKAWMDMPVLLPKLYVDKVDKCSCHEGNHLVDGGVVELIYPPGRALFTEQYTCGRDVLTHTLVDYENRVHKFDFTEGEMKARCKFYRGTTEVVPTDSGTQSIVKREMEFEPLDDTDPNFSSALQESASLVYFHRIAQFLKDNPTEYTS